MAQWCSPDCVRSLSVLTWLLVPIPSCRFRTESYDDMRPVGEDPRWGAFGPFHDYLLREFPLVYVI